MPTAAVLVRNGEAASPWIAKENLLKDYSGAYTTARTVDRTAIFELSMHCQRLHDTATAVLAREVDGASAEAAAMRRRAHRVLLERGPEGLKPLVRRDVRAALRYLGVGAQLDGAGGAANATDYQVTLLLTPDTVGAHTPSDLGFDLYAYVQPLPFVGGMVDVEAHRADRANPTIKDVQWVKDRQALEEVQRQAGVNEIVMFDGDGHITEGLQTNFAAIGKDGVLRTAPDDVVLVGTVRKVALEVAQRHGIPVRLESPNIQDVGDWESCFICSTSRLVKPVRQLRAPKLNLERRFPAGDTVAHRLEALVLEAFRSYAEPLGEG